MIQKKLYVTVDIEGFSDLLYCNNVCPDPGIIREGVREAVDVCSNLGVPVTWFALTESLKSLGPCLCDDMKKLGPIGLHGLTHERPLHLSTKEFASDIARGKAIIEDMVGECAHYRAPCFAIDMDRLKVVEATGFKFDSSVIDTKSFSHYGSVDLEGLPRKDDYYILGGLKIFPVETFDLLGRQIPYTGGGWIRLLGPSLVNALVKLNRNSLAFNFYGHPFEFYRGQLPKTNGGLLKDFRANIGRSRFTSTLEKVVQTLLKNGYIADVIGRNSACE